MILVVEVLETMTTGEGSQSLTVSQSPETMSVPEAATLTLPLLQQELLLVPLSEVLESKVILVELLEVNGQGPVGPAGPVGPSGGEVASYTTGAALGGQRAVTLNSSYLAVYADCNVPGHALRVVGLSLGAVALGGRVDVLRVGEITEPSWNWNTALPIYLGVDGLLTQVEPNAGTADFSLVLGFPVTSTTMFVTIGTPIFLV